MNCFNVTRVCRSINVCVFTYVVDLLQGQRTDSSTLSFNVELTQLMLVGLDRTDFLDEVVVIHSMKKVLDSTLHRPFECVIGIDVDGVAIPRDRELTTIETILKVTHSLHKPSRRSMCELVTSA